MRIKKLATLLLLTVSISGYSQQEAQFSQYMNNNVLVNPAVTGIEENLNLSVGYRNQWNGLTGATNTFFLSGHQRLGRKEAEPNYSLPVRGALPQNAQLPQEVVESKMSPHGLGVILIHDNQGPSTYTSAKLNYAYFLDLSKFSLSFGVSGGIKQFGLDGEQLTVLNPNDNSISNSKMSTTTADVAAGVWLSSENLYAGISLNQLMQSSIQFNSMFNNKQHNHYNVTVGYKLGLTDKIALQPSVLLKYVNPAPVAVDINALLTFDNKFLGGVSFRNNDAAVVLLGYNTGKYQISYSYDLTVSDLSNHSNGSHELMLNCAFGNTTSNGGKLLW